jgi:Zn-dependent protease with chaperone function
LAHVVRGDFIWRMAAAFARAIHFFHPLVYLLTRQLALLQELATDRLAALAVGGNENYLRALTELAIRLDDRNGLRADPVVLPAFSRSSFKTLNDS